MSLPAVHDIDIYEGDDFSLPIRIKANNAYVNLTGWTGRAQLRDTSGVLLAPFVVTIGDQTASPGLVTITMGNTVTGALTASKGVYDIEMTDTGGKVRTYLAGTATIVVDVTRT